MNKYWTEDEIKFLIENKDKYTCKVLGELMNRSTLSIRNKLQKLGLKKVMNTQYVIDRNKSMGRDLSYENLKLIASKYKTRSEFMYMDNSAYLTATRLKCMDDICSHMINKVVSIPQMILKTILDDLFNEKCLYDTRRIIKPYEIDIFYEKFNLGFEYNGKLWHKIHDNTDKKLKLCEEKNITLIVLIENTRNYETDIKEQLILSLDLINNTTKLNITIDDINNYIVDYEKMFSTYTDEDDIKNIINKYDNFHVFKKENTLLYQKLVRMKLLEKYTGHLKRDRVNWDYDLLVKEIEKYDNLKDFYTNSFGCYKFIKNNKQYEYLLENLKRFKK